MTTCVSHTNRSHSKKKYRPIGRRALSLESLEERALLSGTLDPLSVGIESSGFPSASSSYMFANLMYQSNPVWAVGKFGSSGFVAQNLPQPLPPMDANGYPIGLGNLQSQGAAVYTSIANGSAGNFPTGTYTLTFDGKGTV